MAFSAAAAVAAAQKLRHNHASVFIACLYTAFAGHPFAVSRAGLFATFIGPLIFFYVRQQAWFGSMMLNGNKTNNTRTNTLQHIEFFHTDHFETRYHRRKAKGVLARFIDFFWETDFDPLWDVYPEGFSDALFANIGYTYLINLGTPFVMQLEDDSYPVRGDGFLPRNKNMICHHTTGNRIFGIKFKVSPVLFEKQINFREYREYIFPLAYLIDRGIVDKVKGAAGFGERVALVSKYYQEIIEQHSGTLQPVEVVTQVLEQCASDHDFAPSLEAIAARHSITTRTLQRYFEKATESSTKYALQLLRIRKAVEDLLQHPTAFDYRKYGYYDYSHFYKHLITFLNHPHIKLARPHLKLLPAGTIH